MKKYVVILAILIILPLCQNLNGFKPTPLQTLADQDFLGGEQVEIIQSRNTSYGQAVLFHDRSNDTFGVGKIEKRLGFFWLYRGGTYGYRLEEKEPFRAAGSFMPNREGKNQFIIGVRTAENSGIAYVAIGKGPQIPADFREPYNITLAEVQANPNNYQAAPMENNYVLLLADEYNETSWTLTAFDREGNLVADKLFGSTARSINR